jgi:NDP-sugar pyrophosphorylase family protein
VTALVLTAGLGTRLDPLTRLVAKAAVPLAGPTLIERVLAWLRRNGIRDVVLNLHHKPETITAVVGDGAHLGLRVRYSWEHPILGSAGGPRHALDLIGGGTFVIANGDTVAEVPLGPLLETHARSGADATMALVPNPAPHHYNGVRLDARRQVSAFVPAGDAAVGSWHFIGIQAVQASVFEALADGVPAETVAGLYRDLIVTRPGSVRGWPVAQPVVDVGTPADYLRGALALTGGPPDASAIEPGAIVDASARIVRSVVWPAAQVAAGVVLEDCIVAGPVSVPAGLTARRAVLVPAAVARSGDRASIQDGVAIFPMEFRTLAR